MAFLFSLYRAPEGLGPMHEWDCEHRSPLGTREQLERALEPVLGPLSWETDEGASWASCSFAGDAHACELWLFGDAGETLLEVSVCAAPPAIRAIMAGLSLNYCYSAESGRLYFPFEPDDRWSTDQPAIR